jgi:oxygen-independent coproporphyrinogen-3 oxidase
MSWVATEISEAGEVRAGALEPASGTALYVHLPFCVAKCHYCDFFSVPAEGQDVPGTLEAILRELELRAPRAPRTVFIGGGTPSLLDASQLERLFASLEARTGFRASAREVTVECNPESLDRAKAALLLELGVTRISIGFQSLRAETLQLFGRVHDAAQSFRAFEAARSAGAESINVDLMYAVPGQDLEQWRVDLERVLTLGPDHVSAYNLTFEEDTLFRRWLEQGRLERLPEERELEFLRFTRARLRESGRSAYEISNFALDGFQCLHNIGYWHNQPYVGIGPSAVSKVGGRRFGNVKQLGEYRRRIVREGAASAWVEQPGPWCRLGETWWLGLRLTEGLSAREAWDRAGIGAWDEAADPALPIARRLASEGWLESTGSRWRLTHAGLAVADAVAREFLRLGDLDRDASRRGTRTASNATS